MSLPTEVTTVRVRDSYVGFDGDPASGRISFYPTVSQVRATVSDVTILREKTPLVAEIDSTGAFSILLPSTDDPDLTPTGWGYLVVEQFNNRANRAPYTILAPAGPDIVLSEASPQTPIETVKVYVQSVNGVSPDANGNVNVTASVGSVEWVNVLNKPTVFAPTAHTHDYTTGVTGKPSTFPPSAHTHPQSDITGLTAALDNKADASDAPRFLLFNAGWPARGTSPRATFFIGGSASFDAPSDINLINGDVWIPSS